MNERLEEYLVCMERKFILDQAYTKGLLDEYQFCSEGLLILAVLTDMVTTPEPLTIGRARFVVPKDRFIETTKSRSRFSTCIFVTNATRSRCMQRVTCRAVPMQNEAVTFSRPVVRSQSLPEIKIIDSAGIADVFVSARRT